MKYKKMKWFRACKEVSVSMFIIGFVSGGLIASIIVHIEVEKLKQPNGSVIYKK